MADPRRMRPSLRGSSSSMRWGKVVVAALLAMVLTAPAALRLGSEFMPPLNEGVDPLHADGAARHVPRTRPSVICNR